MKRHQCAAAFTLLELLVVMGIISLLISILLPSLGAARGQAAQTVCLTQLKHVAASSRVYAADDPNGFGIPVHPMQFSQCEGQPEGGLCRNPIYIGAYEWGGKSGIGRDDFLSGVPGDPAKSKYGTLAGFGPGTRPLNQILYPGGFPDHRKPVFSRSGAEADTRLPLDLYQCPSDDGPPGGAHCADWTAHPERSSFDHFGNSYASNVFLVGIAGRETGINSPYLRPLSRVPTPSRTLFYEENIGRWAWATRREACTAIRSLQPGIDPGPDKAVRGWHGKDWTFNRSFVDTHAARQTIVIAETEDKHGYSLHYRSERIGQFPPWLDGSRGSYFLYQCIIIRGDGWQKDTLPARVIATSLVNPTPGRPSYEGCVEVMSQN